MIAGLATACNKSNERAVDEHDYHGHDAAETSAGHADEKGVSPTGGNLFTPGDTANPAPNVPRASTPASTASPKPRASIPIGVRADPHRASGLSAYAPRRV